MEGILFQWDKACDAMPSLRYLPVCFLCGFVLLFMFVISLKLLMPINEQRPAPKLTELFDPVEGEYTEAKIHTAGLHNVDVKTLKKVVTDRPIRSASSDEVDNIISVEIENNITGNPSSTPFDDQSWDYSVEVAYIVDSAFGRKGLKVNTGIFVDTRDLDEVSRHSQRVNLDPPSSHLTPLENYNVVVKTLKSVVTNCTYYSMTIFGEERLILGGSQGQLDTTC